MERIGLPGQGSGPTGQAIGTLYFGRVYNLLVKKRGPDAEAGNALSVVPFQVWGGGGGDLILSMQILNSAVTDTWSCG